MIIISILRSTLFAIFIPLWTMAVGIACLPALFLPKVTIIWVSRLWVFGVLGSLKLFCSINREIRGLENIPDAPVIYAVKHQSAWETIVLYHIIKYPCYVLRKELLKLPIFGTYMKKSWNIVVDRDGSVSALKQLVAESESRLNRGLSIIIFPEGTRVTPGEKGRYHPGIAALYTKLDVPIVPVALNAGLYWGRNAFVKTPGTVVMEFLPPIDKGMKRQEFMKALEGVIEPATDRLVEEGRKALAEKT